MLQRLEQLAGRLLQTIDHQVQAPIVQVISGEVFTHEPNSRAQPAQAVELQTQLHDAPAPSPHKPGISRSSTSHLTILQQADALPE